MITTNLNKVVTKGVTTTTVPFAQYLGTSGEITVDTTTAQVTIHDGVTPGGIALGYSIFGPLTAGSGQNTNGPVLKSNAYNIVSIVNNNLDSVSLPPAIAGTAIFVMVPASVSNTLSIWGNKTDTLNGVANSPMLSQAGVATFLCITIGAWFCNSGGGGSGGGSSQTQTYYFELEDGSGCLLLENGSGYIELETGT